jgi:hypothetical protein
MRKSPPGEMTQKAVAARLRPPVTEMTLRRWELGGNEPRNRDWYFSQLADLYGIPVESLNGKVA